MRSSIMPRMRCCLCRGSLLTSSKIRRAFPTIPPFLVIEILSPEDRMVRMLPKIQEYLSIGVEYVWLVDPQEKAALTFSQQDPRGTATEVLRTENPSIEIPLADAFDLDA